MCPVDFNEPSYEAVKVASDLAVHFAAKLTLLHVVEPIPVPAAAAPVQVAAFNVTDYQNHLKEHNSDLLKEVHDKHVNSELDSEWKVVEGMAADEIIDFAAKHGIDVIVMPTHGGSAIGHLVFGSVTDKIVRRASRPVLTIPVKQK